MTQTLAERGLSALKAGQEWPAPANPLPLYLTVQEVLDAGNDTPDLVAAALGPYFAPRLLARSLELLAVGACALAVDGLAQPLDELGLRLLLMRLEAFAEAHKNVPLVITYSPPIPGIAPVRYRVSCADHASPCWVPPLAWSASEVDAVFAQFSGANQADGRQLEKFAYALLKDRPQAEDVIARVLAKQWEQGFRTYDPTRYSGTRCPLRNWLYQVVRNAAGRRREPPPPAEPWPPTTEDVAKIMEDLVERLDRDFVGTAHAFGKGCLELRRSDVAVSETWLAPVLQRVAELLGAKADSDSGPERLAVWSALSQMGVAASSWVPHLRPLDREALELCVLREPPLRPGEAADSSQQACTPLAMRQRLHQAWCRLGERLLREKGPA